MAGRGRGAVLPAWMKAGGATPAPGALTPATAPPAAAVPAGSPAAAPVAAFRPSFPTGGPRGPYMTPRPPPIRQEWTEHVAPDGRRYYFNARLNKSAWEKPDELKAPHERAALASTPASPWAEFTSPDGRKYYYNSMTKESRWTPPEGWPLGAAGSAGRASTAGAGAGVAAAGLGVGNGRNVGGVHVVPPEAIQTGPTPHYATTAEAKDDFKRLLQDAAIPPTLSWEQTSQLIALDRRFGGLKTMGERKAAFNEYVQQKKKDEAEEARRRRAKAKDDFFHMLDGCTSLAAGDATYSEARATLAHDGRWQGVAGGEREREDLYAEWLDEREGSRREAMKAEERRQRVALRSILDASPWVTAATSWRIAQERLTGVESFDALSKVDRLEVWDEFMRELEKKEADTREREREERKKQERVNRAAFRELLEQHTLDGTITAATRWKDYYRRIAEEPALRAVEENIAGSSPKELFLDVYENVEQEYSKHRVSLQAAVDVLGTAMPVVEAETPVFEEFQALFATVVNGIADSAIAAAVKAVPEGALRLFYEELKGRAVKAARKMQDAFISMLSRTDGLGIKSTYEQAEELCSQALEWEAVPGGEEERKTLFTEFLQQAEKRISKGRASSEPEGGGRDGSRRDRKERTHTKDRKRRHRSPESSDSDDAGEKRRSRRHKKSKHHRRDRHRSRSRSRSRSQSRGRWDVKGRGGAAPVSDGEVEEGEVV